MIDFWLENDPSYNKNFHDSGLNFLDVRKITDHLIILLMPIIDPPVIVTIKETRIAKWILK